MLGYIPDYDVNDVLAVLARVQLRRTAPASVEQGARGGHPLVRPWSRRRLSACGWPTRSVPAPKIEYLLSP